jgi:hypothetical protein
VPGQRVQHAAGRVVGGARGFDDQVFFAVADELGVFQAEHDDARLRHLGANGFVPEIEAQAVRQRTARYPCE